MNSISSSNTNLSAQRESVETGESCPEVVEGEHQGRVNHSSVVAVNVPPESLQIVRWQDNNNYKSVCQRGRQVWGKAKTLCRWGLVKPFTAVVSGFYSAGIAMRSEWQGKSSEDVSFLIKANLTPEGVKESTMKIITEIGNDYEETIKTPAFTNDMIVEIEEHIKQCENSQSALKEVNAELQGIFTVAAERRKRSCNQIIDDSSEVSSSKRARYLTGNGEGSTSFSSRVPLPQRNHKGKDPAGKPKSLKRKG